MKRIIFFLFLPSIAFAQLDLPYGIRVLSNKPVDYWYGPYESVEAANATVPSVLRLGRTVRVGSIEYWWISGTADEDLEIKNNNFPGDSIKTYLARYDTSFLPDGWFVDDLLWEEFNKFGRPFKIKFDRPFSDAANPNYHVKLLFPISTGGNSSFSFVNTPAAWIDTTKTYLIIRQFGEGSAGSNKIAEIKEGDVITPNILRFSTYTGNRYNVFMTQDTSSIWSQNGRIRFYDGRTNADSDFNSYPTVDVDTLVSINQIDAMLDTLDLSGGGSVAFADITGDPYDNTNLAGALDAKQDVITGLTSSGAELNILDGATLSTTELNYVDGVTSSIQTQLDGKADLSGDTFTGRVTFTADMSGTSGINIGSIAGNPTTRVSGDMWFDNSSNRYGIAYGTQIRTMTAISAGQIVTDRIPFLLSNGRGEFTTADGFTYLTGLLTVPRLSLTQVSTTSAGTAPLKLASGTLMTTPENGAVEYASSHLYFTIGSTRYQLDPAASITNGVTTSAPNQDQVFDALALKLDKSTVPKEYGIALTNSVDEVEAAEGVAYFRIPRAMTVTAVRAHLKTAQSSGNLVTIDIKENGVSILSTKLTIDNSEKTSTTAATAAVISDTSLADDAEITFDIDDAGVGGVGLIVQIIGTISF